MEGSSHLGWPTFVDLCSEKNIPVVKEAWFVDSIEKQKAQPFEGYSMVTGFPGGKGKGIPWDKLKPEEEAAESLMAEVRFPCHHLPIVALHKFLSLLSALFVLFCPCFCTSIYPESILTPLLSLSIKHWQLLKKSKRCKSQYFPFMFSLPLCSVSKVAFLL